VGWLDAAHLDQGPAGMYTKNATAAACVTWFVLPTKLAHLI
jgi:hypothetical protein